MRKQGISDMKRIVNSKNYDIVFCPLCNENRELPELDNFNACIKLFPQFLAFQLGSRHHLKRVQSLIGNPPTEQAGEAIAIQNPQNSGIGQVGHGSGCT